MEQLQIFWMETNNNCGNFKNFLPFGAYFKNTTKKSQTLKMQILANTKSQPH